MIKTETQYKKAVLKHRIISGLITLTLAGGVIAGGVLASNYDKAQTSFIENSQGYRDYYEQTQNDLLESGEITEKDYEENIKIGPDYSNSNYELYVNSSGTKEEIDQYYKIEKQRLYAVSGAFLCGTLIPVYLMYSHFSKQFLKDDFKENKEKIELIDDNDQQI